MSESPAPTTPTSITLDFTPKTAERSPALSVFISFSLGILLDFCFQPELFYWMILCGITITSWVVCYRNHFNSTSTILLLMIIICLGGMRHHEFWYCHTPNHISRVVQKHDELEEHTQLIRLTGKIRSKPQIQISASDEQFNPDQPTQRTSFILDCGELISNTANVPVSGKIHVTIYDQINPAQTDHHSFLSVGDLIDVCGELKALSDRDNPNDFDFKTHFRKQQIDAVLTVKSSHAATVISQAGLFSWNGFRHKIHDFMAQLIINNTSERTQSIGLALLLGDRSELNPELRKKFSQTGLIHFLAISGLHIGFFTVFIWSICHLLNLPRIVAVFLLLFAIVFYLSIIEIRPPILRAASFCGLVTLGLINWRAITTLNLICVSAIIILVINPTDLFDVGTQLSFLAVSSILWTVQQEFYQNPFQQNWIPLRWRILASDPVLQSPLQWFLIRYFRLLYSVFLVTFFIWVVTAPLVLYYFQLLAPIGLLVNTLIFPFLFLILLLGYLLIFVGPIIPYSSMLFGTCFDYSLRLLLWIVESASAVPFAHFDLPSPPLWWLMVYYILILLAILPFQFISNFSCSWLLRKFQLAIIPVWIIAGILISLFAARSTSLRCTFIAVNHGVSILLETPQGQTILYDAGSMSPVEQTYFKIKNTLLAHGIRRVDLLLISHADRDHFNAASQLVADQYIREIAFPLAFVAHKQQGAIYLCDAADQKRVPVSIIGKGDRFNLGPDVSIEVLHPGFSETFEEDNPASLTILISFQGRRILLTGDLEGDGLAKLLSEPLNASVDVLLAPHHGSLTANTIELDRWANPDYLIVSGGKKQTNSNLQKIYSPNTRIYSTYSHGAITCLIDRSGKLEVIPFHSRK
jgi:competence protein ComEC